MTLKSVNLALTFLQVLYTSTLSTGYSQQSKDILISECSNYQYTSFPYLKINFYYNFHMNDRHHLAIPTQAWKLLFTLLTSYFHTKTFIHSDQFCVPNFLKYIMISYFILDQQIYLLENWTIICSLCVRERKGERSGGLSELL